MKDTSKPLGKEKKISSVAAYSFFFPSQLAQSHIIPVMQTQNVSRCKSFTYSAYNTKGQKEVKVENACYVITAALLIH